MYYEYWDLKKPPFDNVPDPSMYVECHASVENAIAETLFAIEEGNECLAVIVGDVGLGKTISLRVIIDSLDQEKYKIALITNPGITFAQLLREIIGQLTGKQCNERKKLDLLEVFNKLLFKTLDESKKVLIFIDEANAVSPANLENLRLLTNMQGDEENLFTVVLAGQIELARRLEHPKRANLFQRIGTYSRIDKIQSEDLVKTYVETRVKLAGGTKKIFTGDALVSLWEHSEHGVPRLINKIAKLSLKAGETNEFYQIDGKVVSQIGERFQKLTRPAVQKRKPRKKSEGKIIPEKIKKQEYKSEEVIGEKAGEETEPIIERLDSEKLPEPSEESIQIMETVPEEAVLWELEIGEHKIGIDVPSHVIDQAQSFTQEQRGKLAGSLAAQALKKYPQLLFSPSADPVSVWGEIRNLVMKRFGQEGIV